MSDLGYEPWTPQPPEVEAEAFAFLIANATRWHQERHEKYGADHCRICETRKLRAQMKEAYTRMPPENLELFLFRLTIQVDAKSLTDR